MKTKTSILTLSIAALGISFAAPQVDARPNLTVSGEGYHKQQIDPTVEQAPQTRKKKKSYWQKKIGI